MRMINMSSDGSKKAQRNNKIMNREILNVNASISEYICATTYDIHSSY